LSTLNRQAAGKHAGRIAIKPTRPEIIERVMQIQMDFFLGFIIFFFLEAKTDKGKGMQEPLPFRPCNPRSVLWLSLLVGASESPGKLKQLPHNYFYLADNKQM